MMKGEVSQGLVSQGMGPHGVGMGLVCGIGHCAVGLLRAASMWKLYVQGQLHGN